MSGSKDAGEYFERVRGIWEGYGLVAEPVPKGPPELFEYEVDGTRRAIGAGHLLAHLIFPDPAIYLDVEDWVEPKSGFIARTYYAYDLIMGGAWADAWHRHHGSDHTHRDGEQVPIKRTTLEEAIQAAYRIVDLGGVP